jgi:hypothetical protein
MRHICKNGPQAPRGDELRRSARRRHGSLRRSGRAQPRFGGRIAFSAKRDLIRFRHFRNGSQLPLAVRACLFFTASRVFFSHRPV